ncbi:11557_t:CDS:1, partial [Racocetra fulgida]
AMFVLPEEPVIDKMAIEEYDDERRNQFVDIKCVKSELTMNDDKRKKNRIVSKVNEKNVNRNRPGKEHVPDIQMVDDEDLEGYRRKFDCIDKTVKSGVMNVKFDELNQKNETKIFEVLHKKKAFEH